MDDRETDTPQWQKITGRLRVVEGGRSTEPSTSSPTSSEVTRIDAPTFAAELTPCLSLASGVGMSREDRREWLNAAYKAIGHYPIDLLKAGAAVAMRIADHPSKIIPAIVAEVQPVLDRQRAAQGRINAIWQGAENGPYALPAPGQERPTGDEVADICKQYGVGSFAANAPAVRKKPSGAADPQRQCRMPTREDYIRMFGVDPGTLTVER